MASITLQDIGYNQNLEQFRSENSLGVFEVGRVILEHKDRYVVITDHGEFEAELIGSLRFNAGSRYDLPAVGDWVGISEYDVDKALIHAIYPRHSIIERKSVGKSGHTQIIATNIDTGLIVLSVNRDFNINRVERYITICHSAKVVPLIVLSKTDLVDESSLNDLLAQLKDRIKNVPIIPLSNETKAGLETLEAYIDKGKTYCLLGSSGVGKSSLVNSIQGEEFMPTGDISEGIDRGKHVTTHRELIILKDGGILIDNPGMREVGIADLTEGLETTFDNIQELSQQCKFRDCSHTKEKGCAVLDAIETGEIAEESYLNYLKMEKERQHFESTIDERRKKDKEFGKMIKKVMNHKKKHKF